MKKHQVSMEDVAQRAKVSRATVSYVLNGRLTDAITEATRQKVLAAAREMGYRPNRFALALKNQNTHQIEILTPELHPAFYSRVLNEFARQLAPSAYDLRIVQARNWSMADWSGEAGLWPADGLIAFDAQLSDIELASLLSRNTPLVCVGTSYHTAVDHVGVDLESAARRAVCCLLDRGRRRIAYLTRDVAPLDHRDEVRAIAYLTEMKTARLAPEFILVQSASGQTDRQAARYAMQEYTMQHGFPDALFCVTDEFAIGAMAALRALKRRVPEDVAVIGCDGIEDSEYQVPPLSTIVFPAAELARLSWQFLQKRIAEPDAPCQSARLVPELALRESVGPSR